MDKDDPEFKLIVRAIAALAAGASFAGNSAPNASYPSTKPPSDDDVVHRASRLADWIETGK